MLQPAPLSPHSPASPPPPVENRSTLRKRGGQPGNQNARKLGTYSKHQPNSLSHIPGAIRRLNEQVHSGLLNSENAERQTQKILTELDTHFSEESSLKEQLFFQKLAMRAIMVSANAKARYIPQIQKQRILQNLAQNPFDYFKRWYEYKGISRDADSFFIVSKKSAHNYPPLPPDHPNLATNLTDVQWGVLDPLIPPDPYLDFVHGQPPVIIAANRWGFKRYFPAGEMGDIVIMDEHDRILQRAPGLLSPPPELSRKKSGRPRKYSPRALLDAILWKLATGHTWADLPDEFPPVRACQKYYRRLFRSGRFYTLMQALYNHMHLEMCIDPHSLWGKGLFTTTPNQRIALVPDAAPTTENFTALLFMQLACTAWSAFERDRKEHQPFYQVYPLLQGEAHLSTGCFPERPSFIPTSQALADFVEEESLPHPSGFQPLEESQACKKWEQIRFHRNEIDHQVARRKHAPKRSRIKSHPEKQEPP